VQKLSACLSDASEGNDDFVSVELSNWAAEALSLSIQMALGNLRVATAFNFAVYASSFLGGTCADHWDFKSLGELAITWNKLQCLFAHTVTML